MTDFFIRKDVNEALSMQEFFSSGISGAGTLHYIPKFINTSIIGDSILYEDPVLGFIGIANSAPNSMLHIGNESVLGNFTSAGSTPLYSNPKNLFAAATNLVPGEQVVGGALIAQLTGTAFGGTIGFLTSTYNDTGGNAVGLVSLVENDIAGASALTYASAIDALIINYGALGIITDAYGVRVNITNLSGNSIENAYGVYIDNTNINANNPFGIFQYSSETNYLEGNLKIGDGPDNNTPIDGKKALTALHLGPTKELAISFENPVPVLSQQNTGGGSYSAGDTIEYHVSVLDHKGDEVLSEPVVSELITGVNDAVEVSWTAVPGAISYRVYRNVNGGGFNDYIEILDGSLLVFDDGNLSYVGGSLPVSNAGYIHHLSTDESISSYVGGDFRVRNDFRVGGDIIKADPTLTNATLRIFEQGTGGIRLVGPVVPDSIGSHALDFQLNRTSSDKVASGDNSSIFGGYNNLVSGNFSSIFGGTTNDISSLASSILGSNLSSITSSGIANTIVGGFFSDITDGSYNVCAGIGNSVSGDSTFTSGRENINSGTYSHAEGYKVTSSGIASHAQGQETIASGNWSHSEGKSNQATGNFSHAEGYYTTAAGHGSHVGGSYSAASGDYSFAHGQNCSSDGQSSVAFNYLSTAAGNFSFAHGINGLATHINQYAHGGPALSGQRQFTRAILTRNTTDDTPTLLTLSGDEITSGFRYTLDDGKAYAMKVSIAARSAGGVDHLYIVRDFIIQNTGSTTSIAGSIANTLDINTTSWTVDITADDVNDALAITVTGGLTDDIEWVAVVEAVEVYKA